MATDGRHGRLTTLLRATSRLRAAATNGQVEAVLSDCLRELGGGGSTARLLCTLDASGMPQALRDKLIVGGGRFAADGRDGAGLALGGRLGPESFFTVELTSAVRWNALENEGLLLAAAVRLALLERDGAADAARLEALDDLLTVLAPLVEAAEGRFEDAVRRLRADSRMVDTLREIGQRLTAQLDLDLLAQDATDAATAATTARFGAFFYNLVDDLGESYTLYTLSGAPREAFEGFPMPRNTDVFAPTFRGEATVRSDDILADPRYGKNEPYNGMPEGHLAVRSYLAVPVVSPTSHEVLGGFFFGHPEPGRFTAEHERLAEGLAAYTAIALDNARLYARERSVASDLQRRMLPVDVSVTGFDVVTRYLPAATTDQACGDWLDAVELGNGRTAFIVGDVMGKGIPAASTMGQIRTAMRAYALLDLPPNEVLRYASLLTEGLARNSFVTCAYAVHDPAEGTLVYANAGHPAPIVIDGNGHMRRLPDRLGMPLSVGSAFDEKVIDFPAGSSVLFYTDGLVERRGRTVAEGIAELEGALRRQIAGGAWQTDPARACDEVIAGLTGGAQDDDVALLFAREVPARRQIAEMMLSTDPYVAAQGRTFIHDFLVRQGGAGFNPAAEMVATELITNAVRHSCKPLKLRLQHTPGRLLVEVADGDGRRPQRFQPNLDEVDHRGLFIVEKLSEHWGTRMTPDGKVVWAQLSLAS